MKVLVEDWEEAPPASEEQKFLLRPMLCSSTLMNMYESSFTAVLVLNLST